MLLFLSAQGYEIKDNVLYQDNQSTILMLKNGRNSCTGNSRHIHIRYFFVKDRVDKKELRIEYCPSLIMLADFFTKPLQGLLFQKFRDVIMGYKLISSLKWTSFEIKERVGFYRNSGIRNHDFKIFFKTSYYYYHYYWSTYQNGRINHRTGS